MDRFCVSVCVGALFLQIESFAENFSAIFSESSLGCGFFPGRVAERFVPGLLPGLLLPGVTTPPGLYSFMFWKRNGTGTERNGTFVNSFVSSFINSLIPNR